MLNETITKHILSGTAVKISEFVLHNPMGLLQHRKLTDDRYMGGRTKITILKDFVVYSEELQFAKEFKLGQEMDENEILQMIIALHPG